MPPLHLGVSLQQAADLKLLLGVLNEYQTAKSFADAMVNCSYL
jgi:hypothetical protein